MELKKRGIEADSMAVSFRPTESAVGQSGFVEPGRTNIKMAKLVFDSSRSVVIGVRGSTPCARQLLYKSGTVSIDLHLQPQPGSESVMVVGQLLDSLQPTRRVGNVPVSLLRDGNPVSTKKTNDYGEFDFAFETQENVRLAFGLQNQETLVVPLPDAVLTA